MFLGVFFRVWQLEGKQMMQKSEFGSKVLRFKKEKK